MTRDISIDLFDYPLPDNRIASHPAPIRDSCLLLVRHPDGSLEDRRFTDLPSLLPTDSLLVANNTRVINARLPFHKSTGAAIEIFCLEPLSPVDYNLAFASEGRDGCIWTCLVGNAKRWRDGSVTLEATAPDGRPITVSASRITGSVADSDGATSIRFTWAPEELSFSQIIDAAGSIPIPPYLNRDSEASDRLDYQTVYSRIEGSVAAPTAGLHFTPTLLQAIDQAGIPRRELTLHVGAGTFRPVKSTTIGDHDMHAEWIAVDRSLIAELASTDRRIIAVGTTSVRTLESLYHLGCRAAIGQDPLTLPQWYPYSDSHPALSASEALSALLQWLDNNRMPRLIASTRIIIAPGYTYKIVRGMITNFHQPKSTLLLLVSAFTGGDWRPLYNHALADPRYRFLSYGDACLLLS
ncbi:MAG: S-adenosylmethionine:tRNA ribosyltransferase-isomerase [Pseudoflavonifractor sp.]|nr:S-adenosylmethionine:tRNA ribosyltransferase-isomerase [Alloprevotella sp.]MCM1117276.1 S-adenosylmethionine:tRNA ribosyltransferase-isomerase [Pseudoflavonifractor sp.]